MATPVFLETSVIYTHAQNFDIGGEPFSHPQWESVDGLVSKLDVALEGLSTEYVLKEAIDAFNEKFSFKYKDEISLEMRDKYVSQFRTNLADLRKKLEVHNLWLNPDPKARSIVTPYRTKVYSWYDSIDDVDLIKCLRDRRLIEKGLEHSDRNILSESYCIRELKRRESLQFATRDEAFIRLGRCIEREFGIIPRYPQFVQSNE